jgi:hypothetical protein
MQLKKTQWMLSLIFHKVCTKIFVILLFLIMLQYRRELVASKRRGLCLLREFLTDWTWKNKLLSKFEEQRNISKRWSEYPC